jgi:hypothetical protein
VLRWGANFPRPAPWLGVGSKERRFEIELSTGAWIVVRHARDPEKEWDWAAVLTVELDGQRRTVCLYDNAHGQPERHRYRRGVKMEAEAVSPQRSTRLDLPAAIEEIKAKWEGMVERWEP